MTTLILRFDNLTKSPAQKRHYRTHNKSRKGCATCRKRRVKCDEQSPSCKRCLMAHLDCPGLTITPSLQITELDRDELRGLSFFRERTSPGLGGHNDKDFWTHVILRVSYTRRTLQRFIIALGSLDEAFRLKSAVLGDPVQAVARYTFSLQEYGRALKQLLTDARDGNSPFVLLLSSFICYMFEIWLGEMDGPIKHTLAARNLLCSDEGLKVLKDDEAGQILMEYAAPMLLRACDELSIAIPKTGMFASEAAECDVTLSKPWHAKYNHMRGTLSFGHIINEMKELSQLYEGVDLEVRLLELLARIDEWYEDITRSERRDHISQYSWNRGRCLLEIRYRLHRITILVGPLQDEMLYDRFIEDYRVIVECCERLLESSVEKHMGAGKTHDHTTNMTLMFVGYTCRDPYIRRHAVRLLYRYRRLEGIWSSVVSACYTENIMMLEEEGLEAIRSCFDVPASHRIRGISMQFDPGSFAKPRFTKAKTEEEEKYGSQDIHSQPPSFLIKYSRPYSQNKEAQYLWLPLEEYTTGFFAGTRYSAWTTAIPTPIRDEECKYMTSDRFEGHHPNLHPRPWRAFIRHDLESLFNMTLMRASFDPKEIEPLI